MPWREILSILNWTLQRLVDDYPHVDDFLKAHGADSEEELRAGELKRIERAYLCCRQLRGFLGYYALTKAEREAKELLDNNFLSSDNKS